MPKLNPNRLMIEQFYKITIRSLFWNSTGTSQPTANNEGPVPIKVWTTSDNNGIIEINNRQWKVLYHPRSDWNNNRDEYCADYWVVGKNGRKHRMILISPDGSYVGTRSELQANYQSEHIFSAKRRITRRKDTLKELFPFSDTARISAYATNLNLRFVPISLDKPWYMHWKTWARKQQLIFGPEFVLVRRPRGMRTKRFMMLLSYLNKPHKPKSKREDTLAQIDRRNVLLWLLEDEKSKSPPQEPQKKINERREEIPSKQQFQQTFRRGDYTLMHDPSIGYYIYHFRRYFERVDDYSDGVSRILELAAGEEDEEEDDMTSTPLDYHVEGE